MPAAGEGSGGRQYQGVRRPRSGRLERVSVLTPEEVVPGTGAPRACGFLLTLPGWQPSGGSLCPLTSWPGFRLQALEERPNLPSSHTAADTHSAAGIRDQMPASPEARLPRLWRPHYRPRCIRRWRAGSSVPGGAVKKAGMLVPSRRKAPCSPGSLRVAPRLGGHVQKRVTSGARAER